jgi:hypothetical protein
VDVVATAHAGGGGLPPPPVAIASPMCPSYERFFGGVEVGPVYLWIGPAPGLVV